LAGKKWQVLYCGFFKKRKNISKMQLYFGNFLIAGFKSQTSKKP